MTIKEIARLSGVSTATVSYVINSSRNVTHEKRDRVLKVIEQSGYKPNLIAKSLRVRKTDIIGILAEDIRGFPTPSIINGISEFAEQNGYNILLNDLRMLETLFNQYDHIGQHKEKINEAISLLLYGAKVDAVIYVGMFDRDITGIINEINKPLVIAYSTSSDPYTHSVTYDNEDISKAVIRMLLDTGHRRIAVITGLRHTFPAQTRMRGVMRAFSEYGLSWDSALVRYGDWEYSSGYACASELLASSPTAIFAMNDLMAAGAIDAVKNAGLRIPDDISVIGFDNREVSLFLHPRLTTVEIDLKGIGLRAAQTALQRIRGENIEERCQVIPSKLILRDTTRRKGELL